MSTSFNSKRSLPLLIALGMALAAFAAPAQPLPIAKRQCNAASSKTQAPLDPISTASNSSSGAAPAPRFSTYMDVGPWTAAEFPTPDDLGDWNDFLLAFWMANTPGKSEPGPFDMAQSWASFEQADRKRVADTYKAAGKTLRVSMFGASDAHPTGATPSALAESVAKFVRDNYLHGVDVDFEETPAFASASAGGEDFLIELTKALRAALPASEGFVLSHAPQAPYFTTTNTTYPNGAYLKVHKEVGDLIDFYNVQFYNQGLGLYEDCPSLFTSAGPLLFTSASIAGTSVAEILNSTGMPPSKLIIGKPAKPTDAGNGYMDPKVLGACIADAHSEGGQELGGVMTWQWTPATQDEMKSFIKDARGNL